MPLHHAGTQILKTKRLVLRPLSLDDAQAMYDNWASDPQVTRFIDSSVAVAAHEAGSPDCVTHGYSSLLCRLSQAPDLDLQAVARVPKYASLLFQVNLWHLENPF